MLSSKLIKLVLLVSISSSIVVFFSSSMSANKLGASEAKLMTQKTDKNQKEIQLPDHVWKEIEERDKKVQQKRNEDQAKELAKKPPKEREEIEKELKRMKEMEFAPESRTEEELRLEDERVMKQLEKMRRESSY
jgi:hypothetical protein